MAKYLIQLKCPSVGDWLLYSQWITMQLWETIRNIFMNWYKVPGYPEKVSCKQCVYVCLKK